MFIPKAHFSGEITRKVIVCHGQHGFRNKPDNTCRLQHAVLQDPCIFSWHISPVPYSGNNNYGNAGNQEGVSGGFNFGFSFNMNPEMMREIFETSAMMMENMAPFLDLLGITNTGEFNEGNMNIGNLFELLNKSEKSNQKIKLLGKK